MMTPYNFYFMPFIPPNCDKPPTIYSILNSIVNGDEEDEENYTPIKDLAGSGRETIFNFDYPLSENITKANFEKMILNHFLMRRIGFDTVTAFRIQLDVKLNEIMPLYNKMFDALENWNIFNDGDVTTRIGTDTNEGANTLSNTSNTSSTTTSDRRYSDTPQNQLTNVQNGTYLTDYNYDTNTATGQDTATSNGTSNNTNTYNETITRSPADKISIYKEMQQNIKSIYSMIFDELECLFYQLA